MRRDIDVLVADAKRLVAEIRQFSRNQKKDWQKIPWLALQADGRTGYSDQYNRAYLGGYWAIQTSAQNGYYQVSVDLETGELVDPQHPNVYANEGDVLRLASNLGEINAAGIIKWLKKLAKEPVWAGYSKKEQKKWRTNIQKSIGLKPGSYERKKS